MALADDVEWPWSPEETKALISVWSDEQNILKMEQTCRNKHVYREISERLNDLGVKRTWKQCQNKMKALKWRYRQTRLDPSSSDRTTFPLFSELDEFLAAMPDLTESKETGDEEDGRPLPLSSLRLLVPPLRLVSAALWQVVQRRDTMDYGLVEEFVTTVLEITPDLMSYREKAQLVMGLQAQLVLELCRSDHSADPETIQPHLSRMRTCIITHREKEIDTEVEASESNFLELVQTLLDDPLEREHFFQEVFPEEFGPMYDTALQTLMWEFLSRLEKLLPTPTFQQTASWLRPAPSMLKECAQSVTQPQPLKTLLQHHRCHGHLFANAHSSCADDRILSSLSHTFSERVEMDIDEARSHSQSVATCAPRKERDTLIEQDHAEKPLGLSLDTVKKAVEMTDRRNKEWGEENYEERLQHQLAYNVLQVEVVDGEDMSSTSSIIADDVGQTWTPKETEALISVWSKKPILQEMERSYREKHVYGDISEQVKELGVKRTRKQCQTKIKDMKHSYRRALRNPSSSGRATCPFFSELHTFLTATPDATDTQLAESKETVKVSDPEVMFCDQDEGPSVDVKLENLHEEMASGKETHKTLTGVRADARKRDEAFHSPQSDSRVKIGGISHRCEQMVEDASDLDLQPVVMLTQLDETLLMTGGDPRPASHTMGQSSKRSKRAKICSFCGKSFVEAKDLTTHMRSHTEQSPHQCTQCGEGFDHPDDLQKHWQNDCEEMMKQEVNEHQHGNDRISGESSNASRPLPLSSLRLLVPPLRLVSAALWQVVQRRDTMDYGLVEEFVTTVLEITPDLMSYREKVQLVMGLRAQLVLELCRSDHSADPETIQPHLSRMRTCIITHREKEIDTEVEASESNFLELVQTLLDDPLEREHFFQEVFPEEFGPMYDTALQTLMWEFLSRLEKLLPTPTFQQTASWLRPAPSMLKECAQSVTQPQPLKTLLQHHRCHGHLFTNGHSSCADDRILSSLSHTFSERVEMDIDEARSHSQSVATCAPRKERDTLIEKDHAEKPLGMSLDTVKKTVEMTDRRNEEWGEENYEERLQHQLAYNVLQVEIVDGEDMSSTSSIIADDVGWTCWTPDETTVLISVWSDEQILHKMEQSYRKKHVYREISECLKELGVKKTTKQCHNKIKALKWRYRETLRNPSSRPCPFFSQLHKFLAAMPDMPDMPGPKETVKVYDEVVSLNQDEGPVDVE
uniref:C2H2-type domain-containing protein n=1 Tax=Oncorhynchus tshawytscha TaxID=74940 RepID=A0AAZ3QRB2_ONCTS